jgi:hypothetical protein
MNKFLLDRPSLGADGTKTRRVLKALRSSSKLLGIHSHVSTITLSMSNLLPSITYS